MTDHPCPTCGGSQLIDDCKCGHFVENHNLDIDENGRDFCSRCDCRRWRRINCPDCIEGYPKDRIERAAKAQWHTYSTNELPPGQDDWESMPEANKELWRREALAAIRAFHTEGTDT